MKKVLFGSLFFVLIVALAACAPRSVVCPDGTTAKSAEKCPIVQQMQQQAEAAQQAAQDLLDQAQTAQTSEGAEQDNNQKLESEADGAQQQEHEGVQNSELAALIAKSAKVKSYSFGWAPVEIVNGKPVTTIKETYFIKGDEARVETPFPTKYNHATFVPITYINFATQSARGWCTNQEIRECPPEGEERPAQFKDYDIKLPQEWIDEIPPNAVMKDGPSFFNRHTKMVEYQKEGSYYQIYLDSFYGVPLRVGIYSDPDFRKLTGGVEYQNIAFNTVQAEDVTWPGS